MLSDVWRDIISIVSLVVTVTAWWYAMYQTRQAKSAAEAAKAAADKMLLENRRSFQRYAASNAHRYINEAKYFYKNEKWQWAAMHLRDVADQLAQLGALSPALEELTAKPRRWAEACTRRAAKKLKVLSQRKW